MIEKAEERGSKLEIETLSQLEALESERYLQVRYLTTRAAGYV